MNKYLYLSENEDSIKEFRRCMADIGRADLLVTMKQPVQLAAHAMDNPGDVIFIAADELSVDPVEVVNILLKMNKDHKIVLVSGDLQDVGNALTMELEGFLPRPVQQEQLSKLLNRIERNQREAETFGEVKNAEIRIVTTPELGMYVNGKPVFIHKRKERELLLVLAKAKGNILSNKTIAKAIWPDDEEVKNRGCSCSVLIYELKRHLEKLGLEKILCGDRGMYYLDMGACVVE